MRRLIPSLFLACISSSFAELPSWAIGPFERPASGNPVIAPKKESRFDCPVSGDRVNWEALHTFNPAAVVRNGEICVLYRAEDDTGEMAIGRHTSRIGLAKSRDGISFTRLPKPVFFPAKDDQQEAEWPGGCEDPRVVEAPDGTYVMLHTQWNRKKFQLGVATSRNLEDWKKHGSPFVGTPFDGLKMKSAGILTKIDGGRLKATKLNGKYWMYFGERAVHLATSEDLIHWTPLTDDSGDLLKLITPRQGHFDSLLTEVGPPPVLTGDGIVLIYNGQNGKNGDKDLKERVYAAGQVLFSADDPTKVLGRLDKPFYQPEEAFERAGQYAAGTTFLEGLVWFQGRYFLYYGCADSLVGVAMTPKS